MAVKKLSWKDWNDKKISFKFKSYLAPWFHLLLFNVPKGKKRTISGKTYNIILEGKAIGMPQYHFQKEERVLNILWATADKK